jgi:hypothetical protein
MLLVFVAAIVHDADAKIRLRLFSSPLPVENGSLPDIGGNGRVPPAGGRGNQTGVPPAGGRGNQTGGALKPGKPGKPGFNKPGKPGKPGKTKTPTKTPTEPSAVRGANCTARIAVVQTGKDSGCGGGQLHGYPIYDDVSTCHGWRASDTTGRVHDNSVRGMRCLAEGGFELIQFPGSLDCSGTGTVKQFFKSQCHQDIPPTLYSVAVDLDCCSAPETCVLRQPSIGRPDAELFLDGEQCASA